MSFFNLFTQRPTNKITDMQLKEMLEGTTPPLLIDVRTPQEYSTGYIPKSVNIPLDYLEAGIKQMGISMDSPIVVYCQSGMRASQAANILNMLGYKVVYNLGGIGNWSYGLKH